MARSGHWHDRTVIDYLDAAAAELPDKVALTDWNSVSARAATFSYRQIKRLSERLGAGLAALGVGKGDVVSFQLPNWWQFVALHFASVRIGAITNPLMPIFRERELVHMLGLAEAKVLVIPHRFRDFDYPGMVAGIRDRLPALEHILVVGGEGELSFETFVARRWEDETDAKALFASRRQGPNEVTEILYTSGTTGESKGVMHTANTLFGNLVEFAGRLNLSEKDVVLMASPLAHQTGFLYGMVMPIMLKAKMVLQDVWAADQAAQRIQDEGCTFTMAATPFLIDLTDLATLDKFDISTLRLFACGGAPVPEALVPHAAKRLGCSIMAAWGMTENGAVTITKPGDPADKVFGTDGSALPGSQVRVVSPDGKECPRGVEGDLQMRGASLFVGYLKRPQLYGVDAEGWFDTGDCARMDSEGYIRITGRSKDVIIRGGENIPVVEVEGILYRHPSILEVAVVAMPDARLGERACAFIALRPGAEALALADVNAFLARFQIAKQYYPERLEIVEAMPRTPSGKIQKFKLRETAMRFSARS
ncbi:MAG: AMP-binding protein [Betaproteobacteria bacterium]|nr:AMP-binding protein [Betaproteobacteria bacterium]